MRKNRILLGELLTAVECSAQNANERLLELYQRDSADGAFAKPLLIRSMKVSFHANVSAPERPDMEFDDEALMLEFCKSGGNFSCELIVEPAPGRNYTKISEDDHKNKSCKGEKS